MPVDLPYFTVFDVVLSDFSHVFTPICFYPSSFRLFFLDYMIQGEKKIFVFFDSIYIFICYFFLMFDLWCVCDIFGLFKFFKDHKRGFILWVCDLIRRLGLEFWRFVFFFFSLLGTMWLLLPGIFLWLCVCNDEEILLVK